MLNMRGRNYFGPGFWKGGPGPAPWAGGGGGGGRGNPYPYCRFYPWLPRRWWAYPNWNWDEAGALPVGESIPAAPYGGYYPNAPVPQGYPNEMEFLKEQAGFLTEQLNAINSRLSELEQKKEDEQ